MFGPWLVSAGDSSRTSLKTSVSDERQEESRGKAYVEGQQEAGTRACVDLGWSVSGDTEPS